MATFLASLCALALTPAAAEAQPQAAATSQTFALEDIMRHPQWLGRPPQRPFWSSDSTRVYFDRDVPIEEDFDPRQSRLWEVGLEGEAARRVPLEELHLTDSRGGSWSADRRRFAYSRGGDIYVHDLAAGARVQLTRTSSSESQPFHLVDGRVAFSRGSSVFARDLETGLETELFSVRAADDPIEKLDEAEAKGDYLQRQQRRLFRWVDDEANRERRRLELTQRLSQADSGRVEQPWYVGSKREIQRVGASPDGRHALVVLRPKQEEPPKVDQMPRYVTESGYVETDTVRPKVGQMPRAVSLVLLDRVDQELVELDLSVLPGIGDDPLAELRAAAAERAKQRSGAEDDAEQDETATYAGEADQEAKKDAEPRSVSFSGMGWNQRGDRAWIQVVSLDNKDRWIVTVDLANAELRPVHRLTDEAWINWSFRDTGWLDDETLYFLSEETGSSHLYVWTAGDEEARQLTSGDFVVDSPQATPDGQAVYVIANRTHPGNFEVYRVPTAGGELQQVTRLGGMNRFVLSPDGQQLVVTHSTTTGPPELYHQSLSDTTSGPRQLTETISTEFSGMPWVEPEIVEVPSSVVDDPIYSRLYLPDERRRRGRPAVVFVHGAGYLQNAHQGWSGYFREFMFHSLLVERGYVVLDMDFRASAGYGRDWRTAIYRQMGTPELEDLADGVRYLVDQHGVDPDRIGVYGGSYGGFVTFMAMFREPGLFAAGAALRPVTDWAHYNHPYTSNILNTPELDPEAYERSSPIEFAEGLEGHLLICTGMLDDNVLFQDSVRLVQRLIELEKENWEIAIYPVEPHGFREPASWLDEYRRILKLFETTIGGD